MRPKGKLFALLTLFVAIGLVAGTGAFTTVQAERTATVNTAGDASALLGIEKGDPDLSDSTTTPGPNANEYVGTNSNGAITINLASSNGGSGINVNALTVVENIITVSNQGSQDVGVYVTLGSDDLSNSQLTSYVDIKTHNGNSIVGSSNAVTVSPGDAITITIEIDLRGSGLDDSTSILDSITFHAEA